MSDGTIYHNPACGTSRNTLALMRHAGLEPTVVEYLETPPSKATLRALLAAMRLPARALLRAKEAPYAALGLADPAIDDDALLDAMVRFPILIERPIVQTRRGTRLCRPAEVVFTLLPAAPVPPFTKEGGQVVVDPGTRIG